MKYFWLIMVAVLLGGCSPTYKVGVGYGKVLHEPNRLTGRDQFHLKIEAIQPITERWSINTGWHHYSNGSKLGIGQDPNYGLDFFTAGLEFTFNP